MHVKCKFAQVDDIQITVKAPLKQEILNNLKDAIWYLARKKKNMSYTL